MDTLNNVTEFRFPGLHPESGGPSVRCLFTGAPFGNVSLDLGIAPNLDARLAEAVARRAALLEAIGAEGWSELKQVHKDTLLVEAEKTDPARASALEADGACTARRRHALVIKTADCQPVLLAHKSGRYAAALHVGWRGNAIKFIESGVAKFCAAYGLEPSDLMAVRGPSLGPGAAEFKNFAKEWPPEFEPWLDKNGMLMNLWALTRHQLALAGLKPENIFSLDLCTWSLPERYFSYRRGHSGRQASIIMME